MMVKIFTLRNPVEPVLAHDVMIDGLIGRYAMPIYPKVAGQSGVMLARSKELAFLINLMLVTHL